MADEDVPGGRSPWARPRPGDADLPIEPRGVWPRSFFRWGDAVPGEPLEVPPRPAAPRPRPVTTWHGGLALAAGLLAMTAAFMTWATVDVAALGSIFREPAAGTDGDLYGRITALIGLVAFGLAAGARSGLLRREAPAGLAGCGILITICGLLSLQQIYDSADRLRTAHALIDPSLTVVRISTGPGLWLTFAAAGLLVVAGVGGLVRRR